MRPAEAQQAVHQRLHRAEIVDETAANFNDGDGERRHQSNSHRYSRIAFWARSRYSACFRWIADLLFRTSVSTTTLRRTDRQCMKAPLLVASIGGDVTRQCLNPERIWRSAPASV